MELKEFLGVHNIKLHLKGRTKEEIIDELFEVILQTGKVNNPAQAKQSILDREKRMSTGMKHGVAIPHGKTDAVDSLQACIGISDTAVDCDALDKEKCRIFIMTLSPASTTGPHLQFLAEVSSLFKSPHKRTQILAAQSAEEVLNIFLSP